MVKTSGNAITIESHAARMLSSTPFPCSPTQSLYMRRIVMPCSLVMGGSSSLKARSGIILLYPFDRLFEENKEYTRTSSAVEKDEERNDWLLSRAMRCSNTFCGGVSGYEGVKVSL
jgi:hypothetical protein